MYILCRVFFLSCRFLHDKKLTCLYVFIGYTSFELFCSSIYYIAICIFMARKFKSFIAAPLPCVHLLFLRVRPFVEYYSFRCTKVKPGCSSPVIILTLCMYNILQKIRIVFTDLVRYVITIILRLAPIIIKIFLQWPNQW